MAKSIEERMAIVDAILNKGMTMTPPLKRDSLKNKTFGDSCTGFTFEIDTLSYRGSWVSTLEDIRVWVDGVEVPKCDIVLYVNGLALPVETLGGHSEVFWGVKDKGVININKVGGLTAGEHVIKIDIAKRADFGHSYGEGTEGYENATEFHSPRHMVDECTYTI